MTALNIAWSHSPMTEKPSARRRFSREASQAEMREHLRLIVGLAPERNTKAALIFAASVLRLPYGVCKRLLYGEVKTIEAHLADQIRAYVTAAEDLIQKRAEFEAHRKAFVATAHPIMARLAPPAIPALEAEEAAPVARKAAR